MEGIPFGGVSFFFLFFFMYVLKGRSIFDPGWGFGGLSLVGGHVVCRIGKEESNWGRGRDHVMC